MARSPARRTPRPRSPRPRSPRPRSPRPRSPHPKSPRKRSPVRRPASPRRRSGDQGASRRGPRSPPPRLGFGANNGMAGGGGQGGTGGAGGGGGGGGGGRRKGKRNRRRKARRGGGGAGGLGGMDRVPPMSGGNRQPIASMRMRMDDYRPPRTGRLLGDPKDGERGPIEQAVVRARREATTRTKDTFWTKKLLDAEAAQPNRWAHSGFKELYRDELGYSDIGEGSGEEKGGGERASSHPRDPRDPSGIGPRKVGASPSRPRSPRDPRRRTRSRSPHSARISPRRSPVRTGQRSPRASPRQSPKPVSRNKRHHGSRSPSRSRGRKRSYSSSYSRSSSSSSGSSYSRSYSSYSRSSSGSSSSSFSSTSSSSSGSRRRRSYSPPPRRRRSYSSSPHRGRVNRRQPSPQQVRIKQISHQETTKKLVTKTVSNIIKTKTRAIPKLPKLKNKIKIKDGERPVAVPVAVRRKAPRSPAPLPTNTFYDGASVGQVVEEPTDFRGPETPPRPVPEGRHLLDPHHYKVVPPDHPDYHQPPPPPRESPRSEGEDTDSDSSTEDDDGPRRMTLSERFGKLAQLSSQRQEYEGVRMKIVREGGQDKKVYLEGGRLQSRSPSPSSRSRSNHPAHERWLQEHQTEYREYQERYGEIRQWDPHRDLPRELPQNWDDVHVRYRYYKESGYFGDRSITLDDYLKWEQWWYRYRDWLEKYGGTQDVEERDWQYRGSNYEYESRGSGNSVSQGRWVRREASREADDRKRRRY
ncbi:serine/arginine repetitive matrix protein 1-like isoform X1 [Macrobrachium rosenbergii]|uniref:serine/arginine repetitive matrix protein 1-like isoform X1 n=2 Tax=Macrobrachium rosenbergii TaxID=79674 RepID=UPI0034D62558